MFQMFILLYKQKRKLCWHLRYQTKQKVQSSFGQLYVYACLLKYREPTHCNTQIAHK